MPEFRRYQREADFLAAQVAVWNEPVRWRSSGARDELHAGMVAGDLRRVLGSAPLRVRWSGLLVRSRDRMLTEDPGMVALRAG